MNPILAAFAADKLPDYCVNYYMLLSVGGEPPPGCEIKESLADRLLSNKPLLIGVAVAVISITVYLVLRWYKKSPGKIWSRRLIVSGMVLLGLLLLLRAYTGFLASDWESFLSGRSDGMIFVWNRIQNFLITSGSLLLIAGLAIKNYRNANKKP